MDGLYTAHLTFFSRLLHRSTLCVLLRCLNPLGGLPLIATDTASNNGSLCVVLIPSFRFYYRYMSTRISSYFSSIGLTPSSFQQICQTYASCIHLPFSSFLTLAGLLLTEVPIELLHAIPGRPRPLHIYMYTCISILSCCIDCQLSTPPIFVASGIMRYIDIRNFEYIQDQVWRLKEQSNMKEIRSNCSQRVADTNIARV